MNRDPNRTRLLGLAVTTALVSAALAGCTTPGGVRADASATKAERALAKSKTGKAVATAERSVMADPHNAAHRAALGSAYLNDGRFQSAAASFNDAIALGDTGPRTALSMALANIGTGNFQNALAVLDETRDEIAPGDLGLAYALAGQPERGIHILESALRAGENTAKIRQNLAYSYALAGRWREARVMASQDVPADQINDRIGEWAATANPLAFQQRIAALLDVPAGRADPGQPAALALGNTPTVEQLAAEAASSRPATPARTEASGELPPLTATTTAPEPVELARYEAPVRSQPENFEAAVATDAIAAPAGATPAAVIADSVRFVSSPAVQAIPERVGIKPRQKAVVAPKPGTGKHLVQLGSFTSEDGARRAVGVFGKRYSGLGNHPMKITRAVVNGRNYWRVSATGFAQTEARSLCANVKQRGGGCISYHMGSPLPGALN
ncbi:MAG: SPOR domain-containing protein [Novosphingobium sp.]